MTKGFFVKVHVKVITDERLAIYEKMAYVAPAASPTERASAFPGWTP